MSSATLTIPLSADTDAGQSGRSPRGRRRDLQRMFQLLLGTIWLLDGVLQIQPFMFTKGSSGCPSGGPDGFPSMLNCIAEGDPSMVAHTITWNASIVYHQPILTNGLFALIQFLIGIGICFNRTLRPALAVSVVWSLGVWWFGEGAGGVFLGSATPFGGGPGGVLFYAVLAVLLWPWSGSDRPFVAARAVGVTAARVIWAVVWGVLAVLSVVGQGRQPGALHDLVDGLNSGEPGWLTHIDDVSESFFLHHGTAAAIWLAILCLLTGASVFSKRTQVTQVMIVVISVAFIVIWVAVQDFGGILAGGATDPNSGPLVVLLALAYWPLDEATALIHEPAKRLTLSPSAGS